MARCSQQHSANLELKSKHRESGLCNILWQRFGKNNLVGGTSLRHIGVASMSKVIYYIYGWEDQLPKATCLQLDQRQHIFGISSPFDGGLDNDQKKASGGGLGTDLVPWPSWIIHLPKFEFHHWLILPKNNGIMKDDKGQCFYRTIFQTGEVVIIGCCTYWLCSSSQFFVAHL